MKSNTKVLLAVYGLSITRNTDTQITSDFGNSIDLLKLFYEFADHVLKNEKKWPRANERTSVLTCTNLPKIDDDEREVYGYFKAGRNGEAFTAGILDNENSEYIDYDNETHLMREAFYYLYVPTRQKRAYLILQRSQSRGIKDLVRHFFVEFMALKGLHNYRLNFKNLISDKVFIHMMEHGHFKDVTVVKNKVPLNVDEVHDKRGKAVMGEGTVKVIYQAPDLSSSWKEWALDTMRNKKMNMLDGDPRVKIHLGGEDDLVNEVSFRIELRKKYKTFHLVNKKRTQPDMDVTESVDVGPDGRLLIKDMVKQCRELVNDVNLKLNGEDDDAEEDEDDVEGEEDEA